MIRNKRHHFNELSPEVRACPLHRSIMPSLTAPCSLQLQKMLHVPEGFLQYFTAPERFPNLVTTLYNLVIIYFSRDTILGRYVRLLVDETEPACHTQATYKLVSEQGIAEKPVIVWGTHCAHTLWFPQEVAWVELTSASSVRHDVARKGEIPQSHCWLVRTGHCNRTAKSDAAPWSQIQK